MSEYKDFLSMIEIVNFALEIQGRAEESFRRSARNAASDVEKGLFSEIAGDFGEHREKLLMRKHKLLQALSHLRSVEQDGEDQSLEIVSAYDSGTSRSEYNIHNEINVLGTACDPVCDMQVNEEECRYLSVYKSEKYFFCCEDCQKAFELAPEKYLELKVRN